MPQDPAGTSTALMEKRHENGCDRRAPNSQEVAVRALHTLITNAIGNGSISRDLGDEVLRLSGFSGKPLESGTGPADSPDEGDFVMRTVGEAIGTIYVRFGEVFLNDMGNTFVPKVDRVHTESVNEAFAKLNDALSAEHDGERLPIHSFDSVQHQLGDPPYDSSDLQAVSEYLMWLSDGEVTFNHHFPDLVHANDHSGDESPSE